MTVEILHSYITIGTNAWGMNEQENQKFTLLLSDTLPLFQPKHVGEARTEQSSKSENKPQGALHRNW